MSSLPLQAGEVERLGEGVATSRRWRERYHRTQQWALLWSPKPSPFEILQALILSCKLIVTPAQTEKLDAVLPAFAQCCEFVNQNTPPKLKQARAVSGMSSQMTIHAIRCVCAARKVAKQNGATVKGFAPTLATVIGRGKTYSGYGVIQSNDLVAYVGQRPCAADLRIRHMVKNHCLAKSIQDAGWYQFRLWLEHFGRKYGVITIAVEPAYTSQECPRCGGMVKKSLSSRTHVCACGCVLQRDQAAAINILRRGLRTAGHGGTWLLDNQTAWGDSASTVGRSGAEVQGRVVEPRIPPATARNGLRGSKLIAVGVSSRRVNLH